MEKKETIKSLCEAVRSLKATLKDIPQNEKVHENGVVAFNVYLREAKKYCPENEIIKELQSLSGPRGIAGRELTISITILGHALEFEMR